MKLATGGIKACMLATAASVFVAGCGGGGSSPTDSPTSPVPPKAEAPAIATQPQFVSAKDGNRATFSVAATGPGPMTYQWKKDGVAIAGAVDATYTTQPLAMSDSGTVFSVVVMGPGGNVTSASALLIVTALLPVIDVQPVSASVANGGSVTFSVHASSSQPLAYRWLRGGILIDGATTSSLTLNQVSYGDEGTGYAAEVVSDAGVVTSQAGVLSITPSDTVRTIQSCQEITASGSYRVTSDLSLRTPSAACISVHDVSGVQLDCDNHLVADASQIGVAIEVSNVQNFSIKNCRLQTAVFNLKDSANGGISRNEFSPPSDVRMSVVNLLRSHGVTFNDNTISSGAVQNHYGNSNTISNNRVTSSSGASGGAAAILTSWGIHTRILGNTLDGRWNGLRPFTQDGGDDGVVISDETDAVVQDNTIHDFWDCGIETIGTIASSTVRGNVITNTGFCGIGGWYWASVVGSAFVQNIIDRTTNIFFFRRIYGLRPAGTDFDHRLPADTAVAFKDNLFDGNVLANQIPWNQNGPEPSSAIPLSNNLTYSGAISTLSGERAATAADFQLGNNVFKNNDFGHSADAPWLGSGPFPAGLVVDGGLNRCRPSIVNGYPLVCH